MPEWLAVLIGAAGVTASVVIPLVLAARSRDQSLTKMIIDSRDALASTVKTQVDQIHERIGRIRDEYLRRDDFFGHMARMEKQMDDIKASVDKGHETTERQLDDIRKLLQERRSGGAMG